MFFQFVYLFVGEDSYGAKSGVAEKFGKVGYGGDELVKFALGMEFIKTMGAMVI